MSGLLWGVLFFTALIMVGQFPSPSPHFTGAGLAIPFNALIATHFSRIETSGGSMPILAVTSFGGGICNIGAFILALPAIQMICIALGGFVDNSANPVYPRWYCYLMLWLATGTSTGCAAIFFF